MLALASLAFLGLSLAAPTARDDTLITSIYATGTGVDLAPVFYADGLAYIGYVAPDGVSTAVNITFTTTSDSSVPWVISPNVTDATNSSVASVVNSQLFITPNEVSSVGFVAENETIPEGATTMGFLWFGQAVSWAAADTEILQNFWALPTNASDVFQLLWTPDTVEDETALPVVLLSTVA